MVWALGIESTNNHLTAKFLGNDGTTHLGPVDTLDQSGIPTPDCHQRKLIRDVDFSDWILTDATEYFQAYGIKLPPTTQSLHQMYEFHSSGIRFVIPALVLMRALFKPNRHLLPALFGIQGLDNTLFLDHSTNPPQPIIHAEWGAAKFRCSTKYIKEGLTWLACFPSARRMASSVHQHALSGVIGITLPIGKISGAVYGKRINDTVFVSNTNISTITTTEIPYNFASKHPGRIYLMPPDKKFVSPCALPIQNDKDIFLSNGEWAAIYPVLISARSQSHSKLDQKLIFEEILRKIHTNTPWKKMECIVGKWNNLQRAYEHWKKSGALIRAVNLLTEIRAPVVGELYRQDSGITPKQKTAFLTNATSNRC